MFETTFGKLVWAMGDKLSEKTKGSFVPTSRIIVDNKWEARAVSTFGEERTFFYFDITPTVYNELLNMHESCSQCNGSGTYGFCDCGQCKGTGYHKSY